MRKTPIHRLFLCKVIISSGHFHATEETILGLYLLLDKLSGVFSNARRWLANATYKDSPQRGTQRAEA